MKYLFAMVSCLLTIGMPSAQAIAPSPFQVSPHSDVSIEWWYLNAHVVTKTGRHLAMIASFFRLGDAQAVHGGDHDPSKADSVQTHYLIYAITDEDAKVHKAYSVADRNTLNTIQQLAGLAALQSPDNPQLQQVLAMTAKGQFPPPTTLIAGACKVASSPRFSCVYGKTGSVAAVAGKRNMFRLKLGLPGSKAGSVDLTFAGLRPAMLVGGAGNTGVARPDDMHYVSLTRCSATGTIDPGDGSGLQKVAVGDGWFDHQWGSSWTPEAIGWDWFGVQLADGRDIDFYCLRRADDGSTIDTLATFEDSTGKQTTTHNVVFKPDMSAASVWQSPKTGIRYPMNWTIQFPDQNLQLDITPMMQDQEMPILGNHTNSIWEGSVRVTALSPIAPATETTDGPLISSPGKGYMELVGYGRPAMVQRMTAQDPK